MVPRRCFTRPMIARSIAGTVRAKKRYRFALVHAKINIAHDVEAAVAGEQ